ncbi:transposase [Bradyrhizobium sp. LB14.3]|uniref:transposase n=1 Tax=Bradyrhizobium sp. LB14.3 TaxID=3156328 RepID=UPI0033980551
MHHPHVHCVVPGGGLSPDGARWIACRPNFRAGRQTVVQAISHTFSQTPVGSLQLRCLAFLRRSRSSGRAGAFAAHLDAMRRINWVVYAKRPFGGPAQVLAHLCRYTHRVAIAESRLVALDEDQVAFSWKD